MFLQGLQEKGVPVTPARDRHEDLESDCVKDNFKIPFYVEKGIGKKTNI